MRAFGDRLTAIAERWLSRGVMLAAGAAVVLGLAVGVIFVQGQLISSSSSESDHQIQQLEEAIVENPSDPDLRVSLADLYLQEHRYGESIAQYREALKADENRQDALLGLGMAYRQSGDSEQALAAFTKLIELNEESPYASVDRRLEAVHYYLGEIYFDSGEPDKAVEELQAALAIEPTDADALYVLGNALHQQGEYEGAVAVYSLATRFVPDFKEAYRGLAEAAEDNGDELTSAYARAMLRLLSSDAATAVRELEQVVEESPDNAAAYFGLGYGYETLGQRDKAVAAYRRSVEVDPGQYAAQSGLARLGSE